MHLHRYARPPIRSVPTSSPQSIYGISHFGTAEAHMFNHMDVRILSSPCLQCHRPARCQVNVTPYESVVSNLAALTSKRYYRKFYQVYEMFYNHLRKFLEEIVALECSDTFIRISA